MRLVVPWWDLFLVAGVQKTDCSGSRREWRERRWSYVDCSFKIFGCIQKKRERVIAKGLGVV